MPLIGALYGKTMNNITILIALISLSAFAADPFEEFPAKYAIFTDSETGTTEISFRIMGEAGKKMYEGIQQEPSTDDCEMSNTLIKYIGSTQCHYNPDDESHICYFGIDINSGDFGRGISC